MNEVKRKCQGCGKIIDRKNLIKITLSGGNLFINPSSKTLGRSTYVCADITCVRTLIKKKRLYGALKFKDFNKIIQVEKLLQEMVS